MKNLISLMVGFVVSVAVIACNNHNPKKVSEKDGVLSSKSVEKTNSKISTQNKAEVKVELKCSSTSPQLELPTSDVSILINAKEYKLKTIQGDCTKIEVTDYKSHDIPKDASAALSSWYAGAGDYFYAIMKGRNVIVYQGWQDEEQNDDGYHWEKIKTIEIR